MIIDVTGIELTPRNHGKDCIENGEHTDYRIRCAVKQVLVTEKN